MIKEQAQEAQCIPNRILKRRIPHIGKEWNYRKPKNKSTEAAGNKKTNDLQRGMVVMLTNSQRQQWKPEKNGIASSIYLRKIPVGVQYLGEKIWGWKKTF